MKVPFMVLSYGSFERGKKLFSYERHGIHTFPIFKDAEVAFKFIASMNSVLKQVNDTRQLETQVCSDQAKAFEMFETITVNYPDLMHVIVDPSPVTRDSDGDNPADIKAVEDVRDIDDFLEELRELQESKTP